MTTRDPQRGENGRIVGRTRAPQPPPVAADIAFVVIELRRKDGHVSIDDTFSTPAETVAMLGKAYNAAMEAFDPDT